MAREAHEGVAEVLPQVLPVGLVKQQRERHKNGPEDEPPHGRVRVDHKHIQVILDVEHKLLQGEGDGVGGCGDGHEDGVQQLLCCGFACVVVASKVCEVGDEADDGACKHNQRGKALPQRVLGAEQDYRAEHGEHHDCLRGEGGERARDVGRGHEAQDVAQPIHEPHDDEQLDEGQAVPQTQNARLAYVLWHFERPPGERQVRARGDL
mmetsp:Transcript_35993/g.90304  ORF Transcript_35993/g.90304 Transcript_35993/m.90304 type:complete len:208 (-) Transcript_35993:152-775(-)